MEELLYCRVSERISARRDPGVTIMTSKNKQSLDESEQQGVDYMVRSRRLIVVAEGGGASVSARSHEDRARDTWCVNWATPPFQGGDQSGPVWSHRSMTNATLE